MNIIFTLIHWAIWAYTAACVAWILYITAWFVWVLCHTPEEMRDKEEVE